MKRKANAVWQGSGLEGKGSLTTPSGVFDNHPYNYKARFENEDGTKGTNPEELIAAAHAGCFNMALSFVLGGEGHTPEKLDTDAIITMEKEGNDYTVTHIQLNLTGKVPGISKEEFDKLANKAKEGCPVSKALSAVEISLDTTLES